ncbi:MAG: DUF3352 domain-containing protein [Nocardioidaceae bacterium]
MSGHQAEPEYLGTAAPVGEKAPRPGGRKMAGITAGAVAVVAAVGVGGWGLVSFLGGGGDAPAAAFPADAVGYVSVDLDPSASQKIEAFKILEKFPGLRKQLDVGSRDDLRRRVFQEFEKNTGCRSLDYDRDVAPWIGNRVGAAAVPAPAGSAQSVVPAVAVQVGDQAAARNGVDAMEKCGGADHPAGVAFVGDYMLLSPTQKDADRIAAAAQRSSLQDDSQFQSWMSRVGDPGIVTLYASAQAPEMMMRMGPQMPSVLGEGGLAVPDATATMVPGALPSDFPTDLPSDFLTSMPSDLPSAVPGRMPSGWVSYGPAPAPDSFASLEVPRTGAGSGASGGVTGMAGGMADRQTRQLVKNFRGAAAVLRFHDGAVEFAAASGGLANGLGTRSASAADVQHLPASTALALSMGLPHGWVERALTGLTPLVGGKHEMRQLLKEGEAATGLQLPRDVETMLGEGVSGSVDSSLDLSGADSASFDPAALPAGIRIKGDPAKITPLLQKLVRSSGGPAAGVVVKGGDGAVAVGLDRAYVARLAGDGGLGADDTFTSVVPDAGQASFVLYADFDAHDWLRKAVRETFGDDPQTAANLAPLRALGISGWTDGDGVQHGLLRLSTD